MVISGKQQDTLLIDMDIQEDIDLVMMSPQAKQTVCKIMNYGKYRFERAKKEKESKGKQTVVNIKEIRLSPTTDEHDLMTTVNQTIKFLEKKDKVKVTVRFRGREVAYAKAGEMMLDKFAQAIAEHGVIDKKAKLEGKNMSMFVSPKN